jgi:hypothetical protein
MHPLKTALIRALLDEQPGQVYMRWQSYWEGSTALVQCGAYVMTTDPRFTSRDRGTREALLATARRGAGMPPERLISRLYRWHLERRGLVVQYPLDVPVLVKYRSNSHAGAHSTKGETIAGDVQLPKFLRKQAGE